MAYENLKNAIKQVIKQNGNQEITGSVLQNTLLSMTDNIHEVVQSTGEAEDKVMSQKATTDAIQTAIIFDVSVYNNGAVFESISALLGNSNLSTLIPTSVRHGGMIIKFVQGSKQSSDNSYVQYMLKADLFTLDVTKWARVGIDILIQNHTLILK